MKDGNIQDEYPQAAAAGARDLIPLYPSGMVGEYISQGEPGPAEAPVVEVNEFKREPKGYEGGITYFASEACFYKVKAQPGETHEQAVGQDGAYSPGLRGIPYPPGGGGIPDDHGEIDPAEEFSSADALLFQP